MENKLLKGCNEEFDHFQRPGTIFNILWIILLTSILITIVFLCKGCDSPAWAGEIPQDKAVRILVGEASNQGYLGMVCIGEVLRRVGHTKGFYGLNAKHSAHEPAWVWIQARKAWLASATTNYTHGADHFENLKLDTPYWVKNCVLTFRYKDHAFFREVV